MQVDLLCIGNELLSGLVENTNAGYISRRLWSKGISLREQRVIADNVAAIAGALTESLKYSEAVICTGGLGPTDDDLTREAVSEALQRPLVTDQGWLRHLENFFLGRGYPMPPANRKQALAVEGSRLLPNSLGTAPAAIIPVGKGGVVLLPGPPREMKPLFDEKILPFLESRGFRASWRTKVVRTVGCGESLLEEKIKKAGLPQEVLISPLAGGGEVLLQLKAEAADRRAAALLDEATRRLQESLGKYIYGENEETLAKTVARLFTRRGLTLALAESCSGGMLADALTDIPGSSLFFKGSLVTYSDEAKEKLLGVPTELLKGDGAVSEAVALAMARGARRVLSSSVGAAITGIAGPKSDSMGNPAGLFYTALSSPGGESCHRSFFPGSRRAIKERSVQAILAALWRMMLSED